MNFQKIKIKDRTPGQKAWNTKAVRNPNDPRVQAFLRSRGVTHAEFVAAVARTRGVEAPTPTQPTVRVFTSSQVEARKFLVNMLDRERDKLDAASALIDQLLNSIEG